MKALRTNILADRMRKSEGSGIIIPQQDPADGAERDLPPLEKGD